MCFNGAQDPPFQDEQAALHWLKEQCSPKALLAAFRDWRRHWGSDGTTEDLEHRDFTTLAKWRGRQTADVIRVPVGGLNWHLLQPFGSLVREAKRLRRRDDGRLLPSGTRQC